MRSALRLGAAVLLALPLMAACDAAEPEPTASPSPEVTPAASPTDVASPSPSPDAEPACPEPVPDAWTVENIEAIVRNANTEPLLGWVAPTVNVILAASEAYGPRAGDQAVLDFSEFLYLGQDFPPAEFDFAVPETTVDAYRAGDYAEYFPPTVLVARDTDGRVIAFSFDCDGLIETMLLVPDESLLF